MRVQKGGAIRREIRNNVSIIIEFDLRRKDGGPSTTFDLAARCSLGSFVRVLIGGR